MLCMSSQDDDQASQETMKEVMDVAKKVGGGGLQDMNLGETQQLIDTTPGKLTEDDLMKMNASEPEPVKEEEDGEEAVPGNKLTLDDLAEGFQLFKTAFVFFYDTNPPMMWALELKQMMEDGWVPYGNIFKAMKKQNTQIEITMHFCKTPQPCLPLQPPFGLLHIFCLCHP